jgi:methylglutaconyl-CoA hydratase
MYNTIEIEINESVTTIWLNRPEVRNAFNGVMVNELLHAFESVSQDESVRILVLQGRGPAFCAGADLHWMKALGEATYDENLTESRHMAECFYKLSIIPKPVIAIAHGSIMGGGIGLVAAADIAICSTDSRFAFSEVRLGLVPSIISPYVVRRIGQTKARELMLTGRKFSGTEALSFGLVNNTVEKHLIDETLKTYLNDFIENSPIAINQTKLLLKRLSEINNDEEILEYTAKTIAYARKSAHGQKGINAFFEKSKPVWD